MRTFFQTFQTWGDGRPLTDKARETDVGVEYHYEDGLPVITNSYLLDGVFVALDEDELDRMEAWISEHRYLDDHAE